MQPEMEMQVRALSELKPAEYNPREELTPDDKEFQDLCRSINELGYVEPILINSDGTIIAGHQRYNVLKYLGKTEAKVVVVDVDKNRERAINVALNKIDGKWDQLKLRDILESLKLTDLDFTVTGFTQDELDDLNISLNVEEANEDADFDLNETYGSVIEPVTKRGDIWILGRHRLMCGDSTSIEDIEMLMGAEDADLVITDPPYNVDYEGTAGKIRNDNMSDENFYSFLLKFHGAMVSVMRPGAAAYVFHSDSKGHLFRNAFIESGLKLAECLIWEKNALVLGRQDYHWRREPILYGWKEGAGHYFIDDRTQDTVFLEDEIDFEAMKKSDLVAYIKQIRKDWADRSSVIYEHKPLKNDLHPTMKPVSLIGLLMKNSSKSGWNILDPFGGSGTTIIAAEQLNRRAFTMELDEKFCDVIVKRWESFTGQTAVLEKNVTEAFS